MAIAVQQVGSGGTISEVKAGTVLPTSADTAQVTVSRPDDPLLTALVQDTFITGQGGQLALNNNIALATAGTSSTDCANFRAIGIQIVPAAGTVTAGNITFEGSNDNTNFVSVPMVDMATPANKPISTYAVVAATPRYFYTNLFFRYFRARISTGVTGTTTGLQAFSELMAYPLTNMLQNARLSDGTNLTPAGDAVARGIFVKPSDGTTAVAIKAASTAAVAADPAMVVAISPNNNTNALSLWARIGDATNGPAAVKAASTSAAAADPALTVSLSPNLPVPTVHTLEAAATTNATSVKASAGRITALVLTSPLVTATVRFFKLYNKASAPTVGTDIPVMTVPFVTAATNGGSVSLNISDLGIYFSTGIAYAITALATTADTTAVAAGEVKVYMNYI